jgi:predicted nucleotidyltransferase
MKTIGIVAEYNPLHNGHAWQINQAKAHFGADLAVVVAMSGSFTQRGEPAVMDKWTRTRMALACGASLVVELPHVFATASAERFASGGVQLLAATGITRTLVFGSEAGQLLPLETLANELVHESPAFKEHLAGYLDEGLSFAAARQQALVRVLAEPQLAELLRESNNILAVEYLKANARLPARRRLTPVTYPRQGQAYLDGSITSTLSSATAIRGEIARAPHDPAALLRQLSHTMPPQALALLLESVADGLGPVLLEDFALPMIGLLRTHPAETFASLPGLGEGLAQRLVAAARRPVPGTAGSSIDRLASLIEAASSRRFPRTRVQRALLSLLIPVTAEDHQAFDESGGPAYIRVLGFDKKGRYLLKLMREKANRPIITRGSDFLEHGSDSILWRQAQFDLAATDLWMLAAGQNAGADFDRPVVIR